MKNQLLKLRARRAELFRSAQALLNPEDGSTPSAEDVQKAQALLSGEIATLDSQIATYEAALEAERHVPAVSTIQVTDRAAQDPMRGFVNAADFALAVRNACLPGGQSHIDPRLVSLHRPEGPVAAPTGYGQELHGAEGYFVPPAVATRVWELVTETQDLFQLCQPEPTSGNSVSLLADEQTPWAATGIQAGWRAEGVKMDPSRLAAQDRRTVLHELYAFVLATEEISGDAPLLESRLTKGAARAISWKASEAVARGTGAGQPLGWEKAPCLVTVDKESGQAVDTILPKNLVKMYGRLLRMPGDVVRWVANPDIISQLVDLKIGSEPSWVGANAGLQSAPNGQLLGVPLLFTEHAKTLGDLGDIALVNFSGYHAIERRGGIQFAVSLHLFFDYNMGAYRWIFRLGGQPYLSAPVTPPNSAATKSHFVVLQTR